MGTSDISEHGCDVRVISGASTWIEGEALRQLETVSRYPGMAACVGLPDLHPGKGTPIGAAFLARGMIYPHLVGNDIGCGMGLWLTDLPARKAKADKLAARLSGLDAPMDESGTRQRHLLAEAGLADEAALSLGTPGWGNHFLEVQQLREVVDSERFDALGLDRDHLFLLAHTGSRGLGEAVLRRHVERHGAQGLPEGSDAAAAYLAGHAQALAYAELNRRVCAGRLLDAIGGEGRRVLESCHNQVSRFGEDGWLHRKGASPADASLAIIPGSRGDVSVLVAPTPGPVGNLSSLAHGAGRKIARHEARDKLERRYDRSDLTLSPLGGRVVCGDERLLWEEAPDCYKPVASVVGALVEAGLCRIVATLTPLVTFKTSAKTREDAKGAGRDQRRRERRDARAIKEGGWR